MSDVASIHERMIAVLAELPAIGKTQRNTQQNFMFRGHDDVLNALNPLLAKHGIFIVPDVLDRVIAQRTTAKGSVMFEVNLHVRYSFYGAAGDSVTASTWGEGTDMGDKATNKAMTMAFKNALNQAFAISTEETIDSDSQSPDETKSSAPGPEEPAASSTQRQPSASAAASPGAVNPADIKVHFGKNKDTRLGDLTAAQLKWYAEREPQEGYEDSSEDKALRDAAIALLLS